MAMAQHLLVFFVFLVFFYAATIPASAEEYSYVKGVNPNKMKTPREKLSHFRLYWHDIVGGSHPTSVTVVQPVNSSTLFGAVSIIDNPLTVGPDLSSKLVGKAQGLYASVGQDSAGVLAVIMNFAFTHGKYNGSTFTILGRNPVFSTVREMAVVGGSGLFRFARGYALAQTHSSNFTSKDATVEYNVYVLHH